MLEELIRPSRFYDCSKLIRITLTYVQLTYVSMRSIRSYRKDVMIRGSESLRKMIALILPRSCRVLITHFSPAGWDRADKSPDIRAVALMNYSNGVTSYKYWI